MRNIRLLIEYDGTDFHGWQRQREVRTVQGVLESAVAGVFRQRADVIGVGRTDRGVHAENYVCNFHVDTGLDTGRIAAALQAHLPDDVVVRRAAEARPTFHARFDAVARRYRYVITTEPSAIQRRFRLFVRFDLDVAAMDRAARELLGEHDFTSFTPAVNEAGPVCRVLEIGVESAGELVIVTVEANRFLHNMVRAITGTLIDVGRGRTGPERIAHIVRTKDRTAAGPTVPPLGLTFAGARYPDEA